MVRRQRLHPSSNNSSRVQSLPAASSPRGVAPPRGPLGPLGRGPASGAAFVMRLCLICATAAQDHGDPGSPHEASTGASDPTSSAASTGPHLRLPDRPHAFGRRQYGWAVSLFNKHSKYHVGCVSDSKNVFLMPRLQIAWISDGLTGPCYPYKLLFSMSHAFLRIRVLRNMRVAFDLFVQETRCPSLLVAQAPSDAASYEMTRYIPTAPGSAA